MATALASAAALRCEHLVNPLGIDVAAPRLAWLVADDRRGARQTAYQVLVATAPDRLTEAAADLWNSGRVASDQSIQIPYAGKALASRQRAYWTVRLWTAALDGQEVATAYAAPAYFEMGLLEPADWRAQWIQSDLAGDRHVSAPAPYLRKTFDTTKKLAKARLYATALGVYEAYLNGQRVGSDIFAPGWTEYRKRVQYQVYDVTDLLRPGANVLGAMLGDGWYCGFVSNEPRQTYGDRPRFCAQLEITYTDGSTDTIATDQTWAFAFGPIVANDFLQGEAYDARRELGAWSSPDYDAAAWRPVQLFADPGIARSASIGVMVRRQEELPTKAITKRDRGWMSRTCIIDLGQNMVGWARLKAKAPAGTTVTLRFCEILDKDGAPYYENLRSARATDYYTFKGDPAGEVYEPHFTFHGFRYVEIKGLPLDEITTDTLTGVVIHSDIRQTGTFECSDPLVNQLQSNIRWGQKGNYLEVPTDCPQRDERLGWTGDAQVFVRTGAFNYDVAAFFAKWQRDIEDAQGANGSVPPVVPNPSGPGGSGGPAWSDAAVICPWTMYLCYGDTALLERRYASIRRFVDSLAGDSLDGLIRAHESKGWGGFGDWLATDNGRDNVSGRTPTEIIGTAFYSYSARLLSEIAAALGNREDQAKYAALAERVKAAFLERFVTGQGYVYAHTQTAYVLPLQFDLLPAAQRPQAAAHLASLIRHNGGKLTTGFVGSSYLNPALTGAGHLDLAYKLMFQKNWPSWLYAVTQGATTIWERWDGWTHDKGFQSPGMNSFNHYAYGAIGSWLYQTVAGIDADIRQPAYKHIIMQPHLAPKGVPGFTSAAATLDSAHGRIESKWSIDGATFTWRVIIPANTTATLYVPAASADSVRENNQPAQESTGMKFIRHDAGAAVYEATAGTYVFHSKLE